VGVAAEHEPVMTTEVVELLEGRGIVVDATVGAGGHAEALLEADVRQVVGIDRDPDALQVARERLARFGARVRLRRGRFSQQMGGLSFVDGVLFDLGVSSMQIDRPGRGFSYRHDGPLDMRMDREGPSASEIVNEAPEEELANLIFELGEERRSRRVAAAIVRARRRGPIETTDELAGIVASAVGGRRGGPHPARRTFQALRLAVNRELEELIATLPLATGLLAPGGRVVVIAYHSLEDRIAKRFLREDPSVFVLTKTPRRPTATEVQRNPRARSARLRAAERFQVAA